MRCKGKRKTEDHFIPFRFRHCPTHGVGGGCQLGRIAGRDNGGEQNGSHDRQRGIDGFNRAVIHLHATGHIECGQQAASPLAQDIPHDGSYDRINTGLRHKHEENVIRRNTDGVVDINFAPSLIDRSPHRAKHGQRRDQNRHQQFQQPGKGPFTLAGTIIGNTINRIEGGLSNPFEISKHQFPLAPIIERRILHPFGRDPVSNLGEEHKTIGNNLRFIAPRRRQRVDQNHL